jgi:3-deoxy-manno-octulosonate cytidylyltransferase (CMP-KDO synthetase)
MNSIGIIPARYASTRFPGKPLIDIRGKSMIQRVYEQASKSEFLSKAIVATDDKKIYNHVLEFGGEVIMTGMEHENGTTRSNEVISVLEKKGEYYDFVLNIQGDEPYINPEQIDSLAQLFLQPEIQIGTLVKKINSTTELLDYNVVKVVFSQENMAMYFSRNAIPFLRGLDQKEWLLNCNYYKHIGIYGYRTTVLKRISEMSPGILEKAEKLEQLRWLENGIKITVEVTDYESISIDTPKDLLKLETNT